MPPDMNRRKIVMARSMKLGHCICNPRQGCPCTTFRERNICTCAGERPPRKATSVALTAYVRKAGCASKIGQSDLLRVLGNLPDVTDPAVVVGTAAGDDAGVYRLPDGSLLVQTVDVFTPCVDDPHLFGKIAAVNSVSDVYAMGGRPLTALSVIGFPIDELDGTIMEAILQGGIEALDEAGCSLIGGHSINDEEIKCGFSVTGVIDDGRYIAHDAVESGDVLVLTKPLGTGVVCFASQIGRMPRAGLNEVGGYMATLNRDAAELMTQHNAHACTDVTGYGLMGHLLEMVRSRGLTARIDLPAVPVFAAAEACLRAEMLSGAVERNMEYSMAWVAVEDGTDSDDVRILYDPQTSGGLLIAMPESESAAYVSAMTERGHEGVSVIGRITDAGGARPEGGIIVGGGGVSTFVGTRIELLLAKKNDTTSKDVADTSPSCCDSPPVIEDVAETPPSCCDSPPVSNDAVSGQARGEFAVFMKTVNVDGAVDRRTKKLAAIALSVAQRCRPCLVSHMRSAESMGISRAEMEEAAYLGISFAGSPSLMLYNEVCRELGWNA
jgi:selenide, water dikinase